MPDSPLLAEARSHADWIVGIRRRLHRRPELMYEEVETSRLVQSVLGDLQIEHRAVKARCSATCGTVDSRRVVPYGGRPRPSTGPLPQRMHEESN